MNEIEKQLQKSFKQKNKHLKYDFMPSLLEIIERPSNRWGAVVIIGLFALLITAVIWASLAQVDVVITGNGKVVPDGDIKVLQPSVGGNVRQIYVKEGDIVKKGDILVELDTDGTQIDIEYLEENMELLEGEIEIYKLLLSCKTADEMNHTIIKQKNERLKESAKVILSDNKEKQLKMQAVEKALTDERKKLEKLQNEKNEKETERSQKLIEEEKCLTRIELGGTEEEKLKQIASEKENLQNKINTINKNDKKYFEILNKLDKLETTYYIQETLAKEERAENKSQLAEIQSFMNQADMQIENLEEQISSQESTVEQAVLEAEQLKTSYTTEIHAAIAQCQKQLEENNIQLQKSNIGLYTQTFTSPVNGQVRHVSVNSTGNVAAAGESIVSIVPDEGAILIESYISNKDIGELQEGQEVNVKLDAYPYTKYGTVRGVLKYISPDAFYDEAYGLVYKAKVSVFEKEKSKEIQFVSGMTGVIEIKIGTRSVMEYFLEPITRALDNSIKEK